MALEGNIPTNGSKKKNPTDPTVEGHTRFQELADSFLESGRGEADSLLPRRRFFSASWLRRCGDAGGQAAGGRGIIVGKPFAFIPLIVSRGLVLPGGVRRCSRSYLRTPWLAVFTGKKTPLWGSSSSTYSRGWFNAVRHDGATAVGNLDVQDRRGSSMESAGDERAGWFATFSGRIGVLPLLRARES